MIGKDGIEKTINDLRDLGHDITVKDIVFCILERQISSPMINYISLYGKGATTDEVSMYQDSDKMRVLREYVSKHIFSSGGIASTKKKFEDISFEQNKAELIKRLEELKELADKGEIERKEAIKFEIDIRTKLNDKFGTSEKNEEQRVIVQVKYNSVCNCGREIYKPTRKDIIKDLENEGYKIVKS